MVARVHTASFSGIDVLPVEVQVKVAGGLPSFTIVGLPDKAVAESRERIRAAFNSVGLSLPPKRITVNLAPADVMKEGSHYDLPIALGLLIALGAIPADAVESYLALGELSLDGRIARVAGILPAAMFAYGRNLGIICPEVCGAEAAWAAQDLDILAPASLMSLVNHFKGTQVLSRPEPKAEETLKSTLDLSDIKGQESAKRALEIAAAGGHNLLMIGPPGAGKSMLASRLPTILPDLDAQEALELSMIHSVAGKLSNGSILRQRPFRDPHHSASLPSLVGGGHRATPGEVSLSHHGVLFLDELPEFHRPTLEALRQPIETRRVTIARAQATTTYPANFQLVAAMNPCRCGYLEDADRACSRAPKCAADYQSKISGPMFDRIDIILEVAEVKPADLMTTQKGESSAVVAERVKHARARQAARYAAHDKAGHIKTNAQADGPVLEDATPMDDATRHLLVEAADKLHLSGRGWNRVLRVARTIADLEGTDTLTKPHIAEALSFRRSGLKT